MPVGGLPHFPGHRCVAMFVLKPISTSPHISSSVPPSLTCSSGMSGISCPIEGRMCLNCIFGLTTIPASKHLTPIYNRLNRKRWKGRCPNKMHIVEQLDMPGTAALMYSDQHRSSDVIVWMGASDGDKQGFGPGLLNFE